MIFVTVGTARGGFDELIKVMDQLELREEVVTQIGYGTYTPNHCTWFRFEPFLAKYYQEASLIICHEGAGTLLEVCTLGKSAIVVTNPATVDNPDLLLKLNQERCVLWCQSLSELPVFLERCAQFIFQRYRFAPCHIADRVIDFLLFNKS